MGDATDRHRAAQEGPEMMRKTQLIKMGFHRHFSSIVSHGKKTNEERTAIQSTWLVHDRMVAGLPSWQIYRRY